MNRPFTYAEGLAARIDIGEMKAQFDELQNQLQKGARTARVRLSRAGVPFHDAGNPDRVRDVLAREFGFANWSDFEELARIENLTTSEAERKFVISDLAGNEDRCEKILEAHPDLKESLIVACCSGKSIGFRLIEKLKDVDKPVGPFDWPLVLYLCASSFRNTRSDEVYDKVEMVVELLDRGCDANVGFYEHSTIRGYCTALGASIGFACIPAMAQELLAAGADPADGPTLYEGSAMWYAVNEGDYASLRLLIDAEPPFWHICHALPHSIARDEYDMCLLLLRAGADPNWTMGAYGFGGNCLHDAVVLDCPDEVVELLLEYDADLGFKDRAGRTPMALAVALQRTSLARLFLERGSSRREVSEIELWVSACMAEDERRARSLIRKSKGDKRLRFEDHNWLHLAAQSKSRKTIELLLAGGLDVNSLSYSGSPPIQYALVNRNLEAVEAFVGAGADLDAINFRGAAALDLWIANLIPEDEERFLVEGRAGDGALLDALLPSAVDVAQKPPELLTLDDAELFEDAADAVVSGDLTTLSKILDEKPYFVNARSRRPHQCTLLNYIGVNGFEGERQRLAPNVIDVVNLLLDRGSDARAFCYTYRGGPGNNTMGLLASSDHGDENGLVIGIFQPLIRGGVDAGPEWRILVDLYDHQQKGTLVEFAQTLDPDEEQVRAAMREASAAQAMDIVTALLDLGVDVDCADARDVTLLHVAAIKNDLRMVELLLNAGADPRLRDLMYQGNAAGWAYQGEHEELGKRLELLIQQYGDK